MAMSTDDRVRARHAGPGRPPGCLTGCAPTCSPSLWWMIWPGWPLLRSFTAWACASLRAVHRSRPAGRSGPSSGPARTCGSAPVYFFLGWRRGGLLQVRCGPGGGGGCSMGLLTYAYLAPRADLERASDLFRLFREQPTPELAREASGGVRLAISPNERLQQLYHPWSSYLIVPLFALANAGVVISTGLLSRAYTSPVTLGILIGYVVGKPVQAHRPRPAWPRHQAQPGTDPAARGLGRCRGRGCDRRDRLHRRIADRDDRLPRPLAGRGEAGHPVRRVLRGVRDHSGRCSAPPGGCPSG